MPPTALALRSSVSRPSVRSAASANLARVRSAMASVSKSPSMAKLVASLHDGNDGNVTQLLEELGTNFAASAFDESETGQAIAEKLRGAPSTIASLAVLVGVLSTKGKTRRMILRHGRGLLHAATARQGRKVPAAVRAAQQAAAKPTGT